MSAKGFVRASKYRHVNGDPAKSEKQFTGFKASIVPNQDGDGISANTKFFAVTTGGGGAPLIVWSLKGPDYKLPTSYKFINVHTLKLMDWRFNPFIDNCIATGGEDCKVCITVFPEEGLTETISEAAASLGGHQKKVVALEWNPTSNNVLASAGYDHAVKVWDVSQQQCVLSRNATEVPCGLAWNSHGSLLGVVAKDKSASIFDPRTDGEVARFSPHAGTKSSRINFADNRGQIITCGFTTTSVREIKVWDPRNIEKPVGKLDIDQAAGQMITMYDPDTSMLYVTGKGDAGIKFYELTGADEQIYFLNEFRSTEAHKGLCFIPKIGCNPQTCEIAVGLRLMKESIIPTSFQVPRKSDVFQEDIFPDAYAGIPSQEAADFFAGKNKAPVLRSMRPGAGGAAAGGPKQQFAMQKSANELKNELAVANARIAELEAKLKAAGISP